MRLRNSVSSASGTLMRKGSIALSLAANADMIILLVALSSAAAARCAGSRLKAPAAAEVARKLRRVGDNDIADMIILLGGGSTASVHLPGEAKMLVHASVIGIR